MQGTSTAYAAAAAAAAAAAPATAAARGFLLLLLLLLSLQRALHGWLLPPQEPGCGVPQTAAAHAAGASLLPSTEQLPGCSCHHMPWLLLPPPRPGLPSAPFPTWPLAAHVGDWWRMLPWLLCWPAAACRCLLLSARRAVNAACASSRSCSLHAWAAAAALQPLATRQGRHRHSAQHPPSARLTRRRARPAAAARPPSLSMHAPSLPASTRKGTRTQQPSLPRARAFFTIFCSSTRKARTMRSLTTPAARWPPYARCTVFLLLFTRCRLLGRTAGSCGARGGRRRSGA